MGQCNVILSAGALFPDSSLLVICDIRQTQWLSNINYNLLMADMDQHGNGEQLSCAVVIDSYHTPIISHLIQTPANSLFARFKLGVLTRLFNLYKFSTKK